MTGRVDIVRSIYEKIAKKFKLNSQYPETTDFFLTFIDKYTKNKVFWSCDFIFSFLQFLQNLQIIISISFPFSSPYFFSNPENLLLKGQVTRWGKALVMEKSYLQITFGCFQSVYTVGKKVLSFSSWKKTQSLNITTFFLFVRQ